MTRTLLTDYKTRGSPGPGPWSFQADRMHSERDLSWVAGCARMEALLHPGRSVKTDLPLLSGELP